MLSENITVECDILIIGGGCAGTMAAIEAKRLAPAASVCIMEKGHVKRSGSVTTGMDALNVAVLPGVSTPAAYVAAAAQECQGILDQRLSYILAEQSFSVLKLLEQWGVFFPKDADGQYYRLQFGQCASQKYGVGMDEPDLKRVLERKLREAKCNILNHTCAISLLVCEGAVAGAVGLEITTGRLTLCRAKSVILANGSAGRFGLPASGYLYGTFDFPGNAGDGFSLAYHAGARLTGMEYTLSKPLVKDLNAPILNIAFNRGAVIVDHAGAVRYTRDNFSVQQLQDDFYQQKGPFFLKTDHLSRSTVMEIENVLFSTERPMQRRFYEAKNIRIGRDLIELAPTEAQLCGGHGLSGVVINAAAGTDIAGLFAAGDVSAVAMQFLTGAFVFGRIAASSAAAYLRAAPAVPWSGCRAQITADIARLQQLCAAGNRCIHYSEYEYKARKTINDYCVSPKSRKSLQLGIARFQELRAQLPELLRVTNAHELWKAVEIGFILDCAEMSALASLTREESRWGSTHLRLDFPQRDDANWLKHIDISRSPLSGDMRAQARKVGGWL